ncbi:hypothetical protein D3C71_56320 [compost metagenome]
MCLPARQGLSHAFRPTCRIPFCFIVFGPAGGRHHPAGLEPAAHPGRHRPLARQHPGRHGPQQCRCGLADHRARVRHGRMCAGGRAAAAPAGRGARHLAGHRHHRRRLRAALAPAWQRRPDRHGGPGRPGHRAGAGAAARLHQAPFPRAGRPVDGFLYDGHHGRRGHCRRVRFTAGASAGLAGAAGPVGAAGRGRRAAVAPGSRFARGGARRRGRQPARGQWPRLAADGVLWHRHGRLHPGAGLAAAVLYGTGLERGRQRLAARRPDPRGSAGGTGDFQRHPPFSRPPHPVAVGAAGRAGRPGLPDCGARATGVARRDITGLRHRRFVPLVADRQHGPRA